MKETLSGMGIFHALRADPEFQQDFPGGSCFVWRQFCDEVALSYQEQALQDVRINPTSFMKAKLKILRLIEKRADKAQPLDALFFDRATVLELIETFELGIFHESFKDVSEEVFFAHPNTGRFNDTSMILWRKGRLTIRKLLLVQPYALFKTLE